MTTAAGLEVSAQRLVSRLRWTRAADLEPGWPLSVLFVGFPIWWLLGLTQIMCLVIAGVMILDLVRHREVVVPSAFGIWLVFLALTLTGPLVAQVVAPGSVPSVQLSRYFTWVYRMSFLVVGTVALMYIHTLRLSAVRLGRILSAMFVVVVAGGLLGVLAPHLSFPSLIELGMPRRLDANPFIHAQVHPTPAELQDYLGDARARPSAPFAYSNSWGYTYALLVPFFVSSWLGKDAGWRRIAGPFVLLVSLVPIVYSLNRGLWAALIVSLLFVAVRGALTGHVRLLASVLVVVTMVTALLLLSPLGSKIDSRLNGHNSNEGRTNLSSLAVSSTAKGSPVVGFGTTRRVQGSFNSIAQGSTAQCRLCSPPALGTQGQLWTITFSFGLVGAILFLYFFLYHFFRRLLVPDRADTTYLTVVLASLITLPIYDYNYPGVIALMCAVSVLDRSGRRAPALLLSAYTSRVREHWRVVVCCVALGGIVGAASQLTVPPRYQATASVVIPLGTPAPGQHTEPVTLDDVAQEAAGTKVSRAIGRVVHASPAHVVSHLSVTATPTTRILHLTYTADSRKTAAAGARTAATALLTQRSSDLVAERDRDTSTYQRQVAAASAAMQALRRVQRQIPVWQSLSPVTIDPLSAALRDAQENLLRTQTMSVSGGSRLGPPHVKRQLDGWVVWTTSGAALGFLLAIAYVWWVTPRRRRLGHLRTRQLVAGAHVLMNADATVAVSGNLPRQAHRRLERHQADAYLAIGTEPVCVHVANALDRRFGRRQPELSGRSVILVGTARTQLCRLESEVRRLKAGSIGVTGVVVISSTSTPDGHATADRPTVSAST